MRTYPGILKSRSHSASPDIFASHQKSLPKQAGSSPAFRSPQPTGWSVRQKPCAEPSTEQPSRSKSSSKSTAQAHCMATALQYGSQKSAHNPALSLASRIALKVSASWSIPTRMGGQGPCSPISWQCWGPRLRIHTTRAMMGETMS